MNISARTATNGLSGSVGRNILSLNTMIYTESRKGKAMKKYTQSDFDNFEVDENGYKICPSGDYTQISSFGEDCSFGVLCAFSVKCSFDKRCSFDERCYFYNNCQFEDSCSFGDECKFEEFCVFGEECTFGEYCTFYED